VPQVWALPPRRDAARLQALTSEGVILITSVTIDDNEPIERALRRFKKECQKAGILPELRTREFYEKPSVKMKRKVEAARRKARRRDAKLRRRLDRF